MNRTNLSLTKNNILKTVKDVKFVIAAWVIRLIDPVSFFYAPTDGYYLSDGDIDRLIDSFPGGHVDHTGLGELIIVTDGDHRIYVSVSEQDVMDIYLNMTMMDRSTWMKFHNDYAGAYNAAADYVPHTYVDSWTNRILREQPAISQYIWI